MKNFISKILLVTVLISLISWTSNEKSGETKVISETKNVDETTILILLNNYRVKQGLKKLIVFKNLKTYTDAHTNYMIAQNTPSHDNARKRFIKILKTLKGTKIFENVAYNQRTSQEVVDDWITSREHRNNILSDTTHFNLTAKQDSNGNWYYTTIFIKV